MKTMGVGPGLLTLKVYTINPIPDIVVIFDLRLAPGDNRPSRPPTQSPHLR